MLFSKTFQRLTHRSHSFYQPTMTEHCLALIHVTQVIFEKTALQADYLDEDKHSALQLSALLRHEFDVLCQNPRSELILEDWQRILTLIREVQLSHRLNNRRNRDDLIDLDKILMGVKRRSHLYLSEGNGAAYVPEFFEEPIKGEVNAQLDLVQSILASLTHHYEHAPEGREALMASALCDFCAIIRKDPPSEIEFMPRPTAEKMVEDELSPEEHLEKLMQQDNRHVVFLMTLTALAEQFPEQIERPGYGPAKEVADLLCKLTNHMIERSFDTAIPAKLSVEDGASLAKTMKFLLEKTVFVTKEDKFAAKEIGDYQVDKLQFAVVRGLRRVIYLLGRRMPELISEQLVFEREAAMEHERNTQILDNRAAPFPEVMDALWKATVKADTQISKVVCYRGASELLKYLLRLEEQHTFDAQKFDK